MAFDATWSVGNIITVVVTIGGGLLAFNKIVNKLTANQEKQEAAITLLAAHQEAAVALLAQSVDALKLTAVTMQAVLVEQQKQLSSMAVETEVARRMRETERSK